MTAQRSAELIDLAFDLIGQVKRRMILGGHNSEAEIKEACERMSREFHGALTPDMVLEAFLVV